jgi:hypothetical protein
LYTLGSVGVYGTLQESCRCAGAASLGQHQSDNTLVRLIIIWCGATHEAGLLMYCPYAKSEAVFGYWDSQFESRQVF